MIRLCDEKINEVNLKSLPRLFCIKMNCEKEYTKISMQKHILACKERKHRHDIIENDKQFGYFGLSITGKYNKDYWLLIEVKEEATLKDVDKFLRDIWLECCDHLSLFKIDGTLYYSNSAVSIGWGKPVESMNCKLKSILEKGMRFDFEYDFGSTTALIISDSDATFLLIEI